MSNFSMREQLLITFMFLLVFVLAGMWGMQQLNLQKKLLQQQLDKLEYQIKQVRALSSEWKEVQRTPTAPVLPQALSSFVENIARSLEIQDNLQLNVLTNVQKGTEGVKVGLDKLKLDHLLSMLYRLENHRPVLRTSHLNISISPGSRQIRASFQVHKQQRD
ncbi:MAG: type II secretion system protein GspM [SAR324 cluster bacterium]|nr:type II secretion system protein GspM [SAR324 cluster bacterium]MCS5547415.1 type II secretion system protein GspM [SAR324 cluster bacterium]